MSLPRAWPNQSQAPLALFPSGLDVHVGHLFTVRVFKEALGAGGYAEIREAAMTAFTKSWRRE
jgi:hypothetical protein